MPRAPRRLLPARATRSTSFELACAIALAVLGAPAIAAADPAGDKAAAEAVFREGRELMEKNDFAAACPRFEKSLALYQSASAALNLARCYAKTDRLAAALTTIDRAVELTKKEADEARRGELERLTAEQRREIAPRVPTVRVVVSPKIEGMVVERNGIEIPEPMIGAPIPVDPGKYKIRVAAPGYQEVVRESDVTEGRSILVEVTLERQGPVSAVPAAPKPRPGPRPPAPDAAPPVVWPWVVGGIGVAALGVGIGFAVDYGAVRGEVDDHCPDGNCTGLSAAEAEALLGRWDRDVAGLAVSAATGGALLVAGGVGLALAPRDSGVRAAFLPLISPELAGARVVGTF